MIRVSHPYIYFNTGQFSNGWKIRQKLTAEKFPRNILQIQIVVVCDTDHSTCERCKLQRLIMLMDIDLPSTIPDKEMIAVVWGVWTVLNVNRCMDMSHFLHWNYSARCSLLLFVDSIWFATIHSLWHTRGVCFCCTKNAWDSHVFQHRTHEGRYCHLLQV